MSRTQQLRAKRLAREQGTSEPVPHGGSLTNSTETADPSRQRITQYVMNLPDSAITFLGAFRGLLSSASSGGRDLNGVYSEDSSMPIVHCYCFSREAEPALAEKDIRQVSCVIVCDNPELTTRR
jgi:tRNA (guanine37-N1)-methyltransferase